MGFEINDLIKYLTVALAVSLISSTSSALIIEGELNSRDAEMTYESVLDHKEEVVYEQSGANMVMTQILKNKKPEVSSANQVAGRELDGYSKLILTKVDEKTLTIQVDKEEYEGKVAIPLKYTVTAYFAEGSWSDLIANKAVKIMLTAEAKRITQQKVKEYMAQKIFVRADKKARFIGGFDSINMKSFAFEASLLEGSKRILKQMISLHSQFILN